MLSRLSQTTFRRISSRSPAAVAAARRGLVQPSGADRANVVDVPSSYQDDGHFTPRSGIVSELPQAEIN
jgi:cysteine desulfurase